VVSWRVEVAVVGQGPRRDIAVAERAGAMIEVRGRWPGTSADAQRWSLAERGGGRSIASGS